MLTRSFFFLLLLNCIILPSFDTLYAEELNLEKRLQETFIPTLEQKLIELKGSAYAIIYDGKVIAKKTFGYANATETVNEDTLFLLASASKPIMASVIAMLEEEGRVNTNENIASLIQSKQKHLTLKHLLAHSSGYIFTGTNDLERGVERNKIVQKFCNMKAKFTPGKNYRYNNLLFSFTQDIVEKRTKDSWVNSVHKFWNKLGVDKNGFAICEAVDKKNIAFPHTKNEQTGVVELRERTLNEYPKNVCPSAGFFASLNTMIEFLKLQLGCGKNIIKPAKLVELHSPQIKTLDVIARLHHAKNPLITSKTVDANYGLGWRILDVKGDKLHNKRMIFHGGYVEGANTLIAFIPYYKVGIIILANQTGKGYSTFDSVLDFWNVVALSKA